MRHRRIGKKFGRNPKNQRALLKSLAIALIMTEREPEDFDSEKQAPKKAGRIITTLPKAKELRPYIEKLVTKAVRAQKSIDEAAALACSADKKTEEWKAWRSGEGWKNWVKATRATPMILPNIRSTAFTEEISTSTTLLDFSSMTLDMTCPPNIMMNIQMMIPRSMETIM